MGSEQKIGLIETNLDTQETIITGKTQSLLELGGQPISGKYQRHTVARGTGLQNVTNHALLHASDTPDSTRPHKSMEFLLDKENHQQVLVST